MSQIGVKLAAARGLSGVVRRSGRGGGTSLPGKVLLALEPHAIGTLSGRLEHGSVAISATNGKTTTATMAAAVLTRAGHHLVHNRAGANMAGGIASTLLEASHATGGIDGDLGLFEVDEFWLASVCAELQPRAVVLSNLFRDQLDRYGELETIAERWLEVVAGMPSGSRLILNADDPLIADLGREQPGALYFGIEDPGAALAQMQHAADSKHCRRCGAPYRYEAIYLGHLGHYRCPNCAQERPTPDVYAREIVLHGTDAAEFTLVSGSQTRRVRLPLPGLYNVYNALAAAALCLALETTLDQIASGLEAVSAAFGRAETVTIGDHELQLLLIKNPAGANEVLRTLALEPDELDLLAVLNDQTADGRDVSWIWDADFDLIAGRVRSAICSGTRAADLALRLKYAGVATDRLTVVGDLGKALDRTLEHAAGRRVYAVPTYTALLALRDELTARGHVQAYWEASA